MAKEPSRPMIYLISKVLRNPHLWSIAVIIFLISIVHYHELFAPIASLERIVSILGMGLTRHTLERILYLIPIAYGTVIFSLGGGVSILVLSIAAMLPRVFLVSPEPREALFEVSGVFITGLLIVLLFDALQKSKRRLIDLESAQGMLSLQVERLGMLHVISSTASQSLELNQVLAMIYKIRQLINADASWLYLIEPESQSLRLSTFSGLPGEGKPEIIKLGEYIEGEVAVTRKPIIIENVLTDLRYRSDILIKNNIQSLLVVPLLSKGEIIGTLGLGNYLAHHFTGDEVDMVHAIADQVSMAIDNARLYEKQRVMMEALRASESNYRKLFENARDAIWVSDLSGKILNINSAFEKLTGYQRSDLIGSDISMFLSTNGLNQAQTQAHEVLLKGGTAAPYEQEMIRKDKGVCILQIGASLITSEGEQLAFQHIARDVTEEKRVRDNLRYYIQRVSQAQEAERKRIARELHDETAQDLVAVLRRLEGIESGQTTAKEVREQVRNILHGVRQFSQQLRPSILDDLGLLPAMKWLASTLTKNYNITTSVKVNGDPFQLSPEAELTLFRITQEALNNVQKHAGAKNINITVEFLKKKIRIIACDDGKGFEMPERFGDLARNGKLGLAGMEERAQLLGGTLSINSGIGMGTTLTVEIPI